MKIQPHRPLSLHAHGRVVNLREECFNPGPICRGSPGDGHLFGFLFRFHRLDTGQFAQFQLNGMCAVTATDIRYEERFAAHLSLSLKPCLHQDFTYPDLVPVNPGRIFDRTSRTEEIKVMCRSGGIRTHTGITPADFKSAASAVPPPTLTFCYIVGNPLPAVNNCSGLSPVNDSGAEFYEALAIGHCPLV